MMIDADKVAVVSLQTPYGLLAIQADEAGVFSLRWESVPQRPGGIKANEFAEQARREMAEYFEGKRKHFKFPLHLKGTPFQLRVWSALQQIPFGETNSYGAVAAAVKSPRAARAVGVACRDNPVAIAVPCHRVIGKTGLLVGYNGGLSIKKGLLEREQFDLLSFNR